MNHRVSGKVSLVSSALFHHALERMNFHMLEGYGVTLSEIGAKNGKVVTSIFTDLQKDAILGPCLK